MHRGVEYWDTAEMQTVPWILGIAHPTGFPAFVLVGYLFSHILPIGSVAWRIACFSGVGMAAAAWFAYGAARELRVSPPIAVASALIFATTELAWTRGTRAEVHALSICAESLVLFLGLRLIRLRDVRLVPRLCLATGFALAVHPVAVFLLPAIATFLFAVLTGKPRLADRRTLIPWNRSAVATKSLLALVAGPLLYLYMPLRSSWLFAHRTDPTLALGVGPGRPYWDYGHTANFSGFLREVSGSDFTVGGGLSGIFSATTYQHMATNVLPEFYRDFHMGVLLLALIGVAGLWERLRAPAAIALLLGGFLAVPFGASYTSESDVARYFLSAYWTIAVLAGFGAQLIADRLVYHSRHIRASAVRHARVTILRLRNARKIRRVCEIALAVAMTAIPVQAIYGMYPMMYATAVNSSSDPFIDRVLALTPKNAIIVSVWTYATPLAYAAYVDHRTEDRIIETAWPADDAAFIPAWSLQRPVVLVDPSGQTPLPTGVLAVQPLDQRLPALLLVRKVATPPANGTTR